jgi:hypothetical protein
MERSELIEALISKRPQLSAASVRTYASLLLTAIRKSGKALDISDTKRTLDFFQNESGLGMNALKTVFSALLVLTGLDQYKQAMMQKISKYNEIQSSQRLTDKEEKNWVNFSDIKEIFEDNRATFYAMAKQKKLPISDTSNLQKFLIFILSSGVFIPPRRSMDYTELMWEKHDKGNYIDKGKLVFREYKTASTYGTQVVQIPKQLQIWLKLWRKHQPGKWVFTDTSGKKLTSTGYGQRVSSFFHGKDISTSMLRKIYLSEIYKNVPKLRYLQETAGAMGHSVEAAMSNYVKKNDSE